MTYIVKWHGEYLGADGDWKRDIAKAIGRETFAAAESMAQLMRSRYSALGAHVVKRTKNGREIEVGKKNMKKPKPWCARYREGKWNAESQQYGWCIVKNQKNRPDESAVNLETLCGYWITFHIGLERREPTCPDCISKLRNAIKSRGPMEEKAWHQSMGFFERVSGIPKKKKRA